MVFIFFFFFYSFAEYVIELAFWPGLGCLLFLWFVVVWIANILVKYWMKILEENTTTIYTIQYLLCQSKSRISWIVRSHLSPICYILFFRFLIRKKGLPHIKKISFIYIWSFFYIITFACINFLILCVKLQLDETSTDLNLKIIKISNCDRYNLFSFTSIRHM